MTPEQAAIDEVAKRVTALVAAREPGHCIRVADLPGELADGACERAAQLVGDDDTVCLVTPMPTAAWHAEPTKVVELRNVSERGEAAGRLVIFVPAGQRVAAEDSFGQTTFEVVSYSDIYETVVDRLLVELERRDPDVAALATEVIAAVRTDRAFVVDSKHLAAYVAAVADTVRPEAVGASLPLLGLIPDRELAQLSADDRERRLFMNSRQMSLLAELAPPAERVRRISLDPDDRDDREILRHLLEAVSDGAVDRFRIAERLGAEGVAERVDFKRWRLELVSVAIDELAITGLIGDFETSSEPIVKKANASIGVKLRCRPAPSGIDGLDELRLEIVRLGSSGDELLETGNDAVKRRRSLPRASTPQWRMRVAVGDREGGLEEGLYRFRVRALDSDGFELESAVSEVFRVGEVADEDPPAEVVPSIEAAMAAARAVGAPGHVLATPTVSVGCPPGPAGKKAIASSIRFEEVSRVWELRTPSLLARLEAWTIEDPDSLGRYRLAVDSTEIEGPIAPEADPPDEFLRARRSLFAQLKSTQFEAAGDVDFGPSVAQADLAAVAEAAAHYVETWRRAITESTSSAERLALLGVDQIVIAGNRHVGELRLLGPTHPLRLGWLARFRQVAGEWLRGSSAEGESDARELASLLRQLPPPDLPRVLVSSQPMRHLDPLDFYWGLWGPANVTDVEALVDRIRRWLGFGRAQSAPVRVADVVERVRRYLASHPYVGKLIVNFVQPGAGSLVLDLLLALQQDSATSSLTYVVRLFAAGGDVSELGTSLEDFMANPETARSVNKDAADAFLASGEDPLAPKLTYSKHSVDALLATPEAYPAHLTFFLDWFSLRIVPAPCVLTRRSAYAAGLLFDPVVVYRGGDESSTPQWDEQVVLNDDDEEDPLLLAYRTCQHATAGLLGSGAEGDVPTIRLDLDRVSRTILDVVHRSSDWVVIIDPVFTDAFLDEPPGPNEIKRYLIDYVAPTLIGGSRHILVSSRLREELTSLLAPTAARYGLRIPAEHEAMLMASLQSLGSGLALKLLHDRNRAAEALSLALASLYLTDKGVLRHALVIPLDLHQELFREARQQAVTPGLERTDLVVVQIDPQRRHFGLHLVEVKARASLPEAIPVELAEHISEQLDNSLEVLRDRLFAANLVDRRNSLVAALHVRRLSQVMARYVDRGVRFGHLEPEIAGPLRSFLTTLDRSYTIAFRKHGLIFELAGEGGPGGRVRDLDLNRLGRTEIMSLLERSETPLETRYALTEPERLETVLGGRGEAPAPVVVEPAETLLPLVVADRVLDGRGDTTDESASEATSSREALEGPDPDDVLLLGMASRSQQFGIIGALADTGEKVAIDLDGTNVISVFGVQGSGKSYTVGTVIEAGLLRDAHLNRLPSPLAAVVFHYSSDQTYGPEYASMSHPNSDGGAVAQLMTTYGAEPRGLSDIALLVPDAVLERRSAEFVDLPVHRLMLAPRELTLNDWKLLMGIEGGDQMYGKVMTTILRKIRGAVSLESLRSEVELSSMSAAQKNIALTRLAFTDAFVADDGGVSHHVVPGRLLIVDLRDELIEQDEALALFMVLLNRFAQVETADGQSFNKLIVFDEAHKYMNDARLTSAIVETIREMRHRGTSVIIASQNPPSVPREVIELSQVVFAHEFSSPTWLDHIKKVKTAFGGLLPSNLARLSSGQAFVWSAGTDRLQKPQRIVIRPRSTQHGGGTRRATG
jgi:DNA helicase HerA-like ATPase